MDIAGKHNLTKAAYSAKDYVQDGLIVHIDFLENAGYGQHKTGNTLLNLASGSQYLNSAFVTVNDEFFSLKMTAFAINDIDRAMNMGQFTYEIVRYDDVSRQTTQHFGIPAYSGVGGFEFAQFFQYANSDTMYFCIGRKLKTAKGIKAIGWNYASLGANVDQGFATYGNAKVAFAKEDNLQWPTASSPNIYHYEFPVKCMRWYSRCLDPEELEHNRKVDRVRFGI